MKKRIVILLLSLSVVLLLFIAEKQFLTEKTIVINEVRSWDVDVTRTGYYGSDYIELYNTSKEEISLDGWYLSDDESDLLKSRLSEMAIGANDYALIYANGQGDTGDSVLFKINPEGEKIFLSDGW